MGSSVKRERGKTGIPSSLDEGDDGDGGDDGRDGIFFSIREEGRVDSTCGSRSLISLVLVRNWSSFVCTTLALGLIPNRLLSVMSGRDLTDDDQIAQSEARTISQLGINFHAEEPPPFTSVYEVLRTVACNHTKLRGFRCADRKRASRRADKLTRIYCTVLSTSAHLRITVSNLRAGLPATSSQVQYYRVKAVNPPSPITIKEA